MNHTAMQQQLRQAGQWLVVLLAFVVPLSTACTNYVELLLVGTWLLSGQWRAKIVLSLNHTLVRAGLVWISLVLLGVLYSHASLLAIRSALTDSSTWLLLFFVIPFCQSARIRQYALMAFIAAMGLTLVLGVVKSLGYLPWHAGFSGAAVFKNHIVTSYFMAFAAFMSAEFALSAPKKIKIALLGLSVAMVFYVFFLNTGRTGHCLAVFLGLLFAWSHARYKGLLIAVPVLLLIAAGVIGSSAEVSGRFLGMASELRTHNVGLETSLGLRWEFIQTSLSVALSNPWLGAGTGGFESAYAAYLQYPGQRLTNNPHNQYLYVWVEWGLLGLLVLGLVFHRIWQCAQRLSGHEQRIAQGLLFSYMVGCLGNTLFLNFSERHFFILMLAVLLAKVPTVVDAPMVDHAAKAGKPCPLLH